MSAGVMAQPLTRTSATRTITSTPPTTHLPQATRGDQHDLLLEPGQATGLHYTALPLAPQPPPTSITYLKSEHKKHSTTMSCRLRKQPFKKQQEVDGKTPWSSIGNNSKRHQEARVAGSSTGERGRSKQDNEEDLPSGRSKKEEEGEGPVDLGYDPGPREAAFQTKRMLWLPRNQKVRQGVGTGRARYKQCRVAVSPAHVVGERKLASEEEIPTNSVKPTEPSRSVDGVRVSGGGATQLRTSSGAPTLVGQQVRTGGDGLVLGLSVTSSPGRLLTTNDRVPVAEMGLARGGEGVPKSAGLGRKQLGLPGRTGDLACGPGSVEPAHPQT